MSEILGYDVNGEPLRAGNRVEVVADDSPYLGRILVCDHLVPMFDGNRGRIAMQEAAESGRLLCGLGEELRKLKDDSPGKEHYKDQHKPCGQSFRDLTKDMTRVPA